MEIVSKLRTKCPSPGKSCRLRRSMQHSVAVYWREFEILRSFLDADLTAAPLGPTALANSRTGQCRGRSIVVTADWCFRSTPAARDFADRRSRPAHPWLP